MMKDFGRWLNEIGLGDYVDTFTENAIDFDVLADLEEVDLKELGLLLGHRKRLLKAAAEFAQSSRTDTAEAVMPEAPVTQSTLPATPDAQLLTATERRQVAVLFVDLTAYTSLSAKLDPEELQDVMTEFFRVTDDAIRDHGGTVDKHLGDGVMAVFGAPMSHSDDTLRAVRAASSIHEQLNDVGAKLGRGLSSHIGIASGEVLAGADSSQYTVVGDAVNLASRLSDLAKANETYLSDTVYLEVVNEFDCEKQADVAIKGLVEDVTVWKVSGHRDQPLQRKLLPFVGREAERAQFRSTIASVVDQVRGAGFIFRGEPGIGKTRLATECLTIAAENSFALHHVLVLDFGNELGSDPLRAIFKSLLGLSEVTDTAQLQLAADKLLSLPEFEADDEAFVADMLGLAMSEDTRKFYRAIENTTRNLRKIGLVGRLLEYVSRRQPQILLIEDLHWADQVTRELCASLVARTAECVVVLLMTTRIEGDPLDNIWRAGTGSAPLYTIDLRPLTSRETQQLAVAADAEHGNALAIEFDKAGGNPLFLEMMIRSAADNHSNFLPGNLRSMVQVRVDRLDASDRRAIQAAAIAGQRFDLGLVQHLIDEAAYQPTGLLEQSLINPLGEQYLFAHALVQEGVYATVTRRSAQAMHLKAADWFEGRDLVLRAEHLARAEDERAARAYLKAAQSLIEGLRFESAKPVLNKGLAIASLQSDMFELRIMLGRAALQTASLEEATAAYQSAVEHAATDEQACVARLGLAHSYRDRPDIPFVEVNQNLNTTDDLAEKLASTSLKIESFCHRSYMYNLVAKNEDCLSAARSAFALVTPEIPTSLRLNTLECLAMANYQTGRMRSSWNFTEQLLSEATSEGSVQKRLIAGYQTTLLYFFQMAFRDAVQAAQYPVSESERFGMFRSAVVANEAAARAHLALGELDEAEHFAKRSLDFATANGMRARRSMAYIRLFEIATVRRDPEASRLAAKAYENSDSPYIRPWALAIKARSVQDPNTAHQLLSEADSLLIANLSTGQSNFHVRVLQIEDGLDREDWLAIDRAADKLENFTKPEPLPWTNFHINRGRAIADWGRGIVNETAEARLSELRTIRTDTGMKIWLPDDA